jgi:hypothetical protein
MLGRGGRIIALVLPGPSRKTPAVSSTILVLALHWWSPGKVGSDHLQAALKYDQGTKVSSIAPD